MSLTKKQKWGLWRVVYVFIRAAIVLLRTFKLHKDYLVNPPVSIMVVEVLLVVFIIFLSWNTIKFTKDAVDIFREKRHG
jgi:hypothetical protein